MAKIVEAKIVGQNVPVSPDYRDYESETKPLGRDFKKRVDHFPTQQEILDTYAKYGDHGRIDPPPVKAVEEKPDPVAEIRAEMERVEADTTLSPRTKGQRLRHLRERAEGLTPK